MTTVYFIRHAETDYNFHNDATRPLTEKGRRDVRLVTEYLRDKNISAVLSSPYVRAVDTVCDFAQGAGLAVETIYDFRERKPDDVWLADGEWKDFVRRQWADFTYSRDTGECLRDVQARNIAALETVLARFGGQNIAIGTHGTALSTILNHYDKTFGYEANRAMIGIMPWVACVQFDGLHCAGMQTLDLFKPAPGDGSLRVETADFGALAGYRFVVIFARHQGKWLYCRAKTRETYETAGGHIEHGETPLDAARRELFEETGAANFTIIPAFDYAVRSADGYGYSNGQVFLAHINSLGDLPPFEMAEIRLFEAIPDAMRFPQILPVLFERISRMV